MGAKVKMHRVVVMGQRQAALELYAELQVEASSSTIVQVD